MKKIRMILLCVLLIFSLSGCGQKGQEATQTKTSDEKIAETSEIRETLAETENSETDEDTEMKLYFSDIEIPISWENCKAVRELEEEVANGDIIVSMSMYGGWEQVGSLGRSYSRTDHQMTAESGDVVLYNGNQIVVFYGSNAWSYTKLGRMELSQNELEELLSNGDITLTIKK